MTLPVVACNGPAVELMTTSVGPAAAERATWVSAYYKANKPGVMGARFTVIPPAGASVTDPAPATLAAHEFAQARAATLHDVALRERIRARVAAFCAKRK